MRDDYISSAEKSVSLALKHHSSVATMFRLQGRIQRGGQGAWTPLKNHKNIGFHSNTGPDPLKKHKDNKPAFNVGPSSARQRNAI